MEYRPLGRSGMFVSELALGGMMFGSFGNTDHDDSVRIIHRALDAGINFIDTADGYSAGESEEIIGKALADGRRDEVVLAVKFGVSFGDDPNHRGGSRRWITRAIEGSLRRLRTDYIDLYQLGTSDPHTASTRPSRRSPTSCRRARSAALARRRCRPRRSSRPNGWPSGAAPAGSAASSRPTRS